MQAAVVSEFGAPEVLVTSEVADPVAVAGEAVIGVAASDVLWVETRIRQDGGGDYWDMTPPYVPGNGVAGRVRAVGEGVDPAWAGRIRPVIGQTFPLARAADAHAAIEGREVFGKTLLLT